MSGPSLRAGVGRAILTPALGARLIGFIGRESGCDRVLDDLTATALVLDDGATPLAILSCDLLHVHPTTVAQVRDLVHAMTGISGDHLMICCTHTHSAPSSYAAPGTAALDRAYANHLPYLLAGAVRRAWETRQPARLGHASGRTDIGINRRERLADGRLIIGENPAGLCDQEVGVLRVDTIEGVPLVTVVNAVCHPVILGPQSLAVSADFVGQTRRAVEVVTGAPLHFLQGACGDINPRGGVQADDANCRHLGTALAGEVLRVHAGITCDSTAPSLAAQRAEVAMPLRPLPESLQPPRAADSLATLDLRFPWSAAVADETIALEVQALRVGDLGIVSLACEPFTATGLACKATSPFARTFVAGYTNGNIGYVPTADAFPLGGYEVTTAHHYYRLPYPVASEAEALLSRTAQAALGSVSP